MTHQHKAGYLPTSGTGFGICECGASIRMVNYVLAMSNIRKASFWISRDLLNTPHRVRVSASVSVRGAPS